MERIPSVIRGGGSIWSPEIWACPYCESEMHADWVSVGVGLVQCGPYYCWGCGASEVDYRDKRELSDIEKETGCYEPGKPVSSLANTVNGVYIDHVTAKEAYELGILDNKT